MKNKNRKRILVASSITALLLVIVSVAFAVLSTTLNITFSDVTQNALTWNVGFKGSSVTPIQEGTSDTGLSCGSASVTSSTVTIADSTLSKPDDKCTYPLTIENTGDISANLAAIAISQPTNMTCVKEDDATMVCGNITIKLTTESGADFTAGVTVEPGEEYDLNLIVHYTGTTLGSSSVTINSSKVTFAYKQAAKRTSSSLPDGIVEPVKVCKRATTLHTESCVKTSLGCYGAGYSEDGEKNTSIVTYGNLGTKGVLSSGDAFDCDVNGDGTYDATTERFYYVSRVDGDDSNNYAALIYYNNVINGNPTGINKVQYGTVSTYNYNGPQVAYQQLPSTIQWSNVKLSNQTRQIYAENGSTSTSGGALPVFTYTDKAARLLNYKEVNKSCNTIVGETELYQLASCIYLFENTNFTNSNFSTYSEFYWLENPQSSNARGVWVLDSPRVMINSCSNTGTYSQSVRPVIEVPISQISY